jgi:Outer membrane protein beta-barrel domain
MAAAVAAVFRAQTSSQVVFMRLTRSQRISSAEMAAVIAMACLIIADARADDLVGIYVGASAGQSQVEAAVPSIGAFEQNHSAYKLIVGIRPISAFGAEVSYVDFGHPSGAGSGGPTDVSQNGADAFVMFYLPVPIVDVFVKAGFARLQTTVNGINPGVGTCTTTDPNCALFRLEHADSSFAGGAGAQVKFGSLAVRAEYERFSAAGGNPSLVSAGVTWTF